MSFYPKWNPPPLPFKFQFLCHLFKASYLLKIIEMMLFLIEPMTHVGERKKPFARYCKNSQVGPPSTSEPTSKVRPLKAFSSRMLNAINAIF